MFDIMRNIHDDTIKFITTLRMKSSLVLHVPRSGRGLLLLVVDVRFNAVLPLSGFSGSVTSGSRDASVMFVRRPMVISVFSVRTLTPADCQLVSSQMRN